MDSKPISVKTSAKPQSKKVILSKNIRWFLLILVSFINGVLAISGGVFSAAATKIKTDLSINDEKFGFLGTMCGCGNLLGSLLFTLLINCLNNKLLVILNLLIICLGHFMVFLSQNYFILLSGRFIAGLQTICLFLYFPVWVNRFGVQKYKTAFLTIYELSGTLGMVWGYIVNIIVGSDKWRYGFLIEIVIELISVVILIIIPGKYFDKNLFFFEHNQENAKGQKDTGRLESFFSPEKANEKDESDNSDTNEEVTLFSSVICNIELILLTSFRSVQNFICFGMSYWFSDYIDSNLHINNEAHIFYSYVISSVIACVIGLALGGCVGSSVGGYSTKNTIPIITFVHFISTIFSLFIPYMKSLELFTILVFIFNVVEFITAPFVIAATFAAVPKKYTGVANGIIGFFLNITAFLPAPIAYGFLKTKFGSKMAMETLCQYNIAGVVFMVLALCVQRKKNKKIKKKEESGIFLQDIKE